MSKSFHRSSSRISKRREFAGVRVEFAFYGGDNDWLCRLTDARKQPKAKDFTDGYVPVRELGFLWIREDFERWVVTGMLDHRLATTREELHLLCDFVTSSVANEEVYTVGNLDLVKVVRQRLFNGEGIDTFQELPSQPPLVAKR